MIRLYLAGPDVFLPNAGEVARAKVAACAARGIVAVLPFDADADFAASGDFQTGMGIASGNMELMRSCDAILANVTPFGGASADVGTAFEIGFFAALERPIHCYSADPRRFADRVRALGGVAGDAVTLADGTRIEDFGHGDNLMLSGAAAFSGGTWVARPEPGHAAMAAFIACLDAIAPLAAEAA